MLLFQLHFAVSRRAANASIQDCWDLTADNVDTHLVEEYADERMKEDLDWRTSIN